MFIGGSNFIVVKKASHTKFHWSKSLYLFYILAIAKIMIHYRFEEILRCIHLVKNKNVLKNKDDPT